MSTIPGAVPAGTTTTQHTTAVNTNPANKTNANGNAQLSLASNFDIFLKLLTTQLQNQDPSNPADPNQFTQQLVAFAGVQQQVESNTYLKQLLAAVQGNQVASASSYIGTTIEATGNQGGLTNGFAEFGYTLTGAAANVEVTIKDSSGITVFVGSGTGKNGKNIVTWDGKNSFTGAQLPNGAYQISVKATDASGNAVTATPYIVGTVNSAAISDGTVILDVGGLQVPVTQVTKITNLPGTLPQA